MKKITVKLLCASFKFLDDIRDEGSVNMWGASSHLVEALDLDKETARKIHSLWMTSFSKNSSANKRAKEAIKEFE